MFEETHQPLVAPRRFAVRMTAFLIVAAFLDTVGLAIGAVGYHFLEGLDWLDATLNAALVLTGNGPVHPPHTPGGKLFSIFYAMLGVILFAAVIAVLLTPSFHRVLHSFQTRRGANRDKSEQRTEATDENHPVSADR